MMRTNHNQESRLSEAARIMRTSSNPEERSRAAAQLGHIGGQKGGKNSQNFQSSATSKKRKSK